MRALELADGQLALRTDYPESDVPTGSVRVDVIQAGICETDLQLVAGYMDFAGVPGHEFVGIASSGKLAGRRVVSEINCSCNDCNLCSRGLGNHCPNRTVIGILKHDGGFADSLIVPETNLHTVPETLSDDTATLVEPVAAALQIPEQVELGKTTRAIVMGDGRLGNLCAQVLMSRVEHVLVVGKHLEKLKSLAALGIETCVLEETSTDLMASLVIDCTGSNTGLSTALSLVEPRGTVVMKTTIAADHRLSLAPIVIDEVTVVGSRCGPFAKAIRAIEDQELCLDGFISGRFALEDYTAAFARAREKDALKVILEINQS